MPIVPIAGPVGSGKSQHVEEAREPGDVLIDFTLIYVALSGAVRAANGRYPERQDSDPILPLASAVYGFALSEAVKRELNGYATTATLARVPALERITGQPAVIIDPGDDTVIQRHYGSQQPSPTEQCAQAMGRWYGDKRQSGGSGRDATGQPLDPRAEYWVSSNGTKYRIKK